MNFVWHAFVFAPEIDLRFSFLRELPYAQKNSRPELSSSVISNLGLTHFRFLLVPPGPSEVLLSTRSARV